MKKIPRVKHVIQAIILSPSWTKITHLAQKRIFEKFHLSDFYLIIVPYQAEKLKKKSFEQILRYKLASFWVPVGPKLPIWLKTRFSGTFHLNDFYPQIAPITL